MVRIVALTPPPDALVSRGPAAVSIGRVADEEPHGEPAAQAETHVTCQLPAFQGPRANRSEGPTGSGGGPSGDWDEAEQAVCFRVDEDYKEGAEVFTSYARRGGTRGKGRATLAPASTPPLHPHGLPRAGVGPRSSGDLLLTYGFVPRNRKVQADNEKVDLRLQVDPNQGARAPDVSPLLGLRCVRCARRASDGARWLQG